MQNFNSDQLRTALAQNTTKMNRLAEQNDLIVATLKRRGLCAVDPSDDKYIPVHSCVMQLDKLRERGRRLSLGELNAGGWWCADAGRECEALLAQEGLHILSKKWRHKKYIAGCFSRAPGTVSQFTKDESASDLIQIHRKGASFYWGAPL